MRILSLNPVEVRRVALGEEADLFHSFAFSGGRMMCAFRRHLIRDVRFSSDPDLYRSRIYLQEFCLRTMRLVGEPDLCLDPGEDPRLVDVDGRLFILSTAAPGSGLNYVLYDVDARRTVNIVFEGAEPFVYGKNWQPFAHAGGLFAVHGFAPFRLLRIDTETGRARLVREVDTGIAEVAPHDGYSYFRGGGSAMVLGASVVGIGHFTRDQGRHSPFWWRFDTDRGQVQFGFDFDLSALRDAGYRIFDPTSLVVAGDRAFVGLSCSNRDWFYAQSFASVLCEIDLADLEPVRTASRRCQLETTPATLDAGAFPRRLFYRAAELQRGTGADAANFERVADPAFDALGYICFGPYQELPSGHYEVKVQYAADGVGTDVTGGLDVACSSGQRVLTQADFMGTEARLSVCHAEFDISPAEAPLVVETRCLFSGVSRLRITDISVTWLREFVPAPQMDTGLSEAAGAEEVTRVRPRNGRRKARRKR